MDRRGRNSGVLWGLILLVIVYIGLLRYLGTLTGVTLLDGIIGVALGLYVCSHPAANGVDLLFRERRGLPDDASAWSGVGWLALNLLVLVGGWLVIVTGTTRLVD